VDVDSYRESISGALFDPKQAARDACDAKYLSAQDRLWYVSANVSSKLKRKEALWQFEEQHASFGMVDFLVHTLLPKCVHRFLIVGIFNRFNDYCAWSKWETALFLPKVPKVGKSVG
jgi:hypothetical protein